MWVGRRKTTCKECDGGSICEHGRRKTRCLDCDGSDMCKSRREPYNTGCRQYGNRKYGGFVFIVLLIYSQTILKQKVLERTAKS